MKLIIRADDLGFSEGVNCGIHKAIDGGMVTCVGLMTNMESAKHGYHLIKDYPVCIGLHTNVCAGSPISDPSKIPSLVQQNGEFCRSREIHQRKEDLIVIEEAEIEIEAQLQRFREITGRNPDYLEFHAISSQNFMQAIQNVANRHGLFYENPIFDKEWEKQYGIKGFDFAKMDEKGLYNPYDYMNEHLKDLENNDCCIAVFHPGYLDQYILTHSSFTNIRAMECEFLCSDWLKQWIKEHQIQLVDFRNYKNGE